jgi:pilus assembly protein CpaE
MADRLSIAIVDSDKSVRKSIQIQLELMGNVELYLIASNTDEALEEVRAKKPDIVILELTKDSSGVLRWIEQIKLEFPESAIFVSSFEKKTELVISAMRAGAQEFLSRPIGANEIKEAVEKVIRIKAQKKAQVAQKGRIISVFSKKGGMGVTTLAVNLAIALSQLSDTKTALIDLDLQLGDITSFMNLSPDYNIFDVLNERGEVDPHKLQSCMTRHESGVFVLAEPKNPADSENISSSQINQILLHLRSIFSYIIIDMSHKFDSKNLEVFDLSDTVVVVTVPNISSLRAAKKVLGSFRDLGYARDKIRLVVNRTDKRDPIKPEEIEKTLHRPISWMIPNDYPTVIEAINTGIPLVSRKGTSKVAKSIKDLANQIPEWSRSLSVERKP